MGSLSWVDSVAGGLLVLFVGVFGFVLVFALEHCGDFGFFWAGS